MIVPSIDIQDGQAVQLVGGRDKAIDGGDPLAVAERFAVAGELAVIDLDAAMGKGDNGAVIAEIVRRYPARVGGGIRSREAALRWLDAGAEKVILGTAAKPELLAQLPRARVIAALDAAHGEVVVEGWKTKTGERVEDRIDALREHVGGFLLTFVELEGRLGGTDLERARALTERAGDARVTIAGGVTRAEEIAALDAFGADAQVGMALYSGKLALGDAFAAPLRSDRADGLWPTVVCDEHGVALGLCYSDAESLRLAIAERRGIYHSRSRGLWRKGETSGDVQELVRVELDCDRDALCFTVRQQGGGFCHTGTFRCFGEDRGLGALERRIAARIADAPEGSYTRRLLDDPELLASKLAEEARELSEARGGADVAHETADVMYFALVTMKQRGVDLAEVARELDRRALRVQRRPGDAKPNP
ncbi:MAG: phosphoribosyl-ATP diphosphatase [Myxococcales bacterium]|nr:phosphoribosyl-ATP diphosphatase [Myxococcales bacterium]